jgi:hypothetical protein
MSGICSALSEALVAVGVMTRVEVPLGATTEDFWAVGAGVDPQPSAANSREEPRLRSPCTPDAEVATSGVRAEGANSHFCFLVRKPGTRGDETDYLWVTSMYI